MITSAMVKDAFIGEDFLLHTNPAQRLYHDYAEQMPIIDFHCHLPPEQIACDHSWDNITRIWLYGDHYKWRAMRSNGIPERYCTGDATDREKFDKLAETMPRLLRNPLYHWTHLELKKYFGISDRLLCPETADGIWNECNEKLKKPELSCRGILRSSNVKLLCTTDDPIDSLEHHQALSNDDSFDIAVLPAWRPDAAMNLERPQVFNDWTDRLAVAVGDEISDLPSFLNAIKKRHDFFHTMGCRLSDHGLETIYAEKYGSEIEQYFKALRHGRMLEHGQALKLKSALLHEFAVLDCDRGWVQQFHLGAQRNNNTRMFNSLGPDVGFDSIGDFEIARPLADFLDRLDNLGKLPKTIIYNINPRDNAVVISLIGSFQESSTRGKMQYGSAWWFADQLDGMKRQIEDLSQMGLLGGFVGMVTDSRSFLSYTRHDYFRRLLCNILGRDMVNGLIPQDFELVGGMVRDICYNNAVEYFNFNM